MSGLRRVLVVPAAGRGSRLGSSLPKALVPVNGRPMLAHLAERYHGVVADLVAVIHPSWRAEASSLLKELQVPTTLAEQPEPAGMLDAVLIGIEAARTLRPARVWVTWCDQIGVLAATSDRLAACEAGAEVAFPVVHRRDPYIHFDRDAAERIVGVRQRREGDAMPPVGESDMGLFSLSSEAAFQELPAFARSTGAQGGSATGERNFLPFIPWIARQDGVVVTCPATDPREAIGVNTPEELELVAGWLRERAVRA